MRSLKKNNAAVFSQAEMNMLLCVAKNAISRKLERKAKLSGDELNAFAGKYAKRFSKKQGAFVTLTINERLRGCIGSLQATKPLLEAIYSNALNAAFFDTRFMPIAKKEFEQAEIEVSVLSPLSKLVYSDAADLLSKLVPHKHGVLLEFSNGAGSTFLPQVWDQLPDAEEFLSHLCTKAGMPSNAYASMHPAVFLYTVQCAQEKTISIR
jgi:AmmeMemoRadiSam system protein A